MTWNGQTMVADGGGTTGHPEGDLDGGGTLQAPSPACGDAQAPATPVEPHQGSRAGPGIATDEQTRRANREARAEAVKQAKKDRAAARKAERKARRRARLAVLEDPPRVDKAWGFWVAGGVLVAGLAGFGWNISKRTEPATIVQNIVPNAQPATATSTPDEPSKNNPLAGVNRPLSSTAALLIGAYHDGSGLTTVRLVDRETDLTTSRLQDVAGQLWALGPTDPCKVGVEAPDARRPIVVKPDASGKTPEGVAPLFDCTTPTSGASGS